MMNGGFLTRGVRSVARIQSRCLAVKPTVEAGYDSRNHSFFAPADPVQRVFFERIMELESQIEAALTQPVKRSPAEMKEVESFIQAERQKLGLTDSAYDVKVKETVSGNSANLRDYIRKSAQAS